MESILRRFTEMNMKIIRVVSVALIFIVFVTWTFLLIYNVENDRIHLALSVVLGTSFIMLYLPVFKRDLRGALIINKKRQSVNWYNLIILIIFFFNPITRSCCIAMLIALSIIHLIYYFKKPVGIVIEEDNLLTNDLYFQSRKVSSIRHINFNGFLESISITFSSERDLVINQNIYDQDKLKLLFELLLKKNPNIKLSKNLKDRYQLSAASQLRFG